MTGQIDKDLQMVQGGCTDPIFATLQVAGCGLAAARQRHRDCSDLVSEMEVQSSAIDNARGSVETHYTYIHTHLSAFMEQ